MSAAGAAQIGVAVLGSTGSVGESTLDVVARHPARFRLVAIAANSNAAKLARQVLRFRPDYAALADPAALPQLRELLGDAAGGTRLLAGPGALEELARLSEVQCVMAAIVGAAGLASTLAAAAAGKRLLLANKESLVMAGPLLMAAVQRSGATLLPIDSEHNGAHQCLRAGNRNQVSKLILTASGGPFRNTPREALAHVTPQQALNHPTWRMGNRITIDSATLMNKGFEVIEACWLFDFAPSQVDVVIHPQSSVHAMIEYSDGSVLAQIAATDMRMPIQYALTYPERFEAPVPKIDWRQARQWEFLPPDFAKFPLLKLAYHCMEAGGSATCTLNAADEIAVEAFLEGRIPFPAIWEVVQETLSQMPVRRPATVGQILEIDRESRSLARELVMSRTAGAVTA